MIALTLPCDVEQKNAAPFVARLGSTHTQHDDQASLIGADGRVRFYQLRDFVFSLPSTAGDDYDGDIVFIDPATQRAQRWIRAKSLHNTLLVTEQCDQLCRMCSQPPKKTHVDHFDYFLTACRLAPAGVTIGFSGGEPTLHKEKLFSLLECMDEERPDMRFHVLTNGQHFEDIDFNRLRRLQKVLWGVPLYSADAPTHDFIVGKEGAFERLEKSLAILTRAGASVELRTVLMQTNAGKFDALADYVVDRLAFIEFWAIMQIERIGFAKNGWHDLFYDHSKNFSEIGAGLSHALLHGINVSLYNFPLCTLPEVWRPYAEQSISDWKHKYLDICTDCAVQANCAGFFEWHPNNKTYERMGPL